MSTLKMRNGALQYFKANLPKKEKRQCYNINGGGSRVYVFVTVCSKFLIHSNPTVGQENYPNRKFWGTGKEQAIRYVDFL
jgi:hypothetical protein